MLNLQSGFLKINKARFKRRGALAIGVALYVAVYNWLYVYWLAPAFGYLGFTYKSPSTLMFCLSCLCAVAPALWMPIELTRPSHIPYWILYLLVYIPSMFGPLCMGLQPESAVFPLIMALFAGLVIIGLSYCLPVLRFKGNPIPSPLFWSAFVIAAVVLNVWVIVVFRSQMKLVGLQDVYDLRFAARDLAAGTKVEYASMWLSALINPLLMARGVVFGRRSLVALGVVGQVVLYSTNGQKGILLSTVMLAIFYFILRRRRYLFGVKIVLGTVLLLLCLCLVASVVPYDRNSLLSFALMLIFLRTFANGGYTTGLFYDFFSRNPHTHWTNVHGLSLFFQYPYAREVGLEVGYYVSRDPTLNLNAHFWATDGIAGFGLMGIAVASILCALSFWLLDCAASKHNLVFACLAMTFVTLNLANLSIFTSLFSGGLGLLIATFAIMPAQRGEGSRTSLGFRTDNLSV